MKIMKFIQTYYFILVIIIGNAGCDLKHDNTLDPKNPNAAADQIAVVENFVIINTNVNVTAPEFNTYSLNALYELEERYDDNLITLEYHMTPNSGGFEDSLAISDNELRYANEYKGSASRGFPHAFFNGKSVAVQGASSLSVAKQRYQTVLDSVVSNKEKLYVTATKKIDASQLTLEIQIARYGDEDLTNAKIEYIVYEDKGMPSGHYAVREVRPSETLPLIPAKTIYEFTTDPINLKSSYVQSQIGVVVIIKSALNGRILQAARAF